MAAHLRGDLLREVGARIEHGQEQAAEVEARVEVAPDRLQGARELSQALQGEVFALDGHQHLVSGREGVQGQQA